MAKLYFNFGAMNAGKSTILLQAAHNYQERGMRTLLLTPAVDTRAGTEQTIASRIGLTGQAKSFKTNTDLEAYVVEANTANHLDCVLVDEAQFLTSDQVWQLARLADLHRIPIMCYGLRTDFQGRLFPGSATLLAVADNIKEIKTLCWCGRKATMTLRIGTSREAITEGTQIEIGGNDKYISLCRNHWARKEVERPS
ncbi:MAG: thymidine kinase [Alphaproteobacteria bacterium]